jgi:hypothetical protein
MTDRNKVTVSNQASAKSAQPAQRWLNATERRAAHFAEVANKQATLKAEAAERRAAREARTEPTT